MRKLYYLLVFISIFFTLVYIFSSNNDEPTKFLKPNLEPKRVLMYTKYFTTDNMYLFDRCKPINCEFTRDKKLFSKSDGVVFHFADIAPDDIPKKAFPEQKFVYFSLESPFSTIGRYSPKNYFNWLMSYNNKSDVTFEYGSKWIETDTKVVKHNYTDKVLSTKKNEGIIGYISNCYTNSARGQIIDKLKKHINVTVYGKCTNLHDGCKVEDYNCEEKIINNYYFFFALENAVCNNYITEKYWKRYTFDSVPIVMKRHIYTDVGIPNSSFIAVDDFKSSLDMSNYLKYLITNPKEYMKYFEHRNSNWKVIESEKYDLVNGICNLCTKLREKMDDNKVIDNVDNLYASINQCVSRDVMYKFAETF
uniref:Fucosyltransferase n=1 Tax=Parastrongyloides trichosuri TaxID=131310 RepID=A0A0N5A712_PARTI